MSTPDESPPTLASLRAALSKPRSQKPPAETSRKSAPNALPPSRSAQPTLLFNSPAVSAQPVKKIQPVLPAVPKPAPERHIWSLRDLVSHVRQHIEASYTDLWIEGEISNCRPAGSGHIYFTLKDGEAQLPVVLFRRQASLLRFRPADGLAVLVRGRLSVYETRGQLQLTAQTMEPRGAGALQLAFEQLKARLLAEGLFDAARKRPLPAFPGSIGIITSPTGSVIRDIVTVIRRRHARLNLLIYPATMQGNHCCSTVAAGIRWFNENNLHSNSQKVDLILLARGGGSLEDLSGFNDEALARTISASAIPVVSAIGHETDFTIADFVSDLRAATPSAAAELITAAQHRIEERIDSLSARVRRAIRFFLLQTRQRLAVLSTDSVLLELRASFGRREQHLDELHRRLRTAIARRHRTQSTRLDAATLRLSRRNPVLRLAHTRHRLQTAEQLLRLCAARATTLQRNRLAQATATLESLSPLSILSRGYALVYSANGAPLHAATDTVPGERLHIRLAHGSLSAEVEIITPE